MRALAACWVLVHHANQSVGAFIGPLPLGSSSAVIANGYLGVDFFFVLSGFIIAFSSQRLLETGRGFGDYARARLIRIYVPYLPIGIGILLLYLLFPGLSAADRSPGLLTSLTLLPTDKPPALSVAWTLIHEMLFYALYSLIFISRRLLWVLLTAWAGLISYYAEDGQPLQPLLRYVLSPLNLCFLLGVVVYHLTHKGVTTLVAVAGGVGGILILALEAGQIAPERWLLALGFSGFIVCALSTWAQQFSPGQSVLFLGAASYSIYLVHNPSLSAATRVTKRFLPSIDPLAAFVLISASALLAGVAYYYFYERHGLRLIRRVFASSPKHSTAALTSITVRADDR